LAGCCFSPLRRLLFAATTAGMSRATARERFDDVCPQRAHARQRGGLVLPNHRRIANDIGCQDAGQTAVGVIHLWRLAIAHVLGKYARDVGSLGERHPVDDLPRNLLRRVVQ